MTAQLGDRVSDAHEGWSGIIVTPMVVDQAGALEALTIACDTGAHAGALLRVDMRGCMLALAEGGWERLAREE
jgi:hypothetical protein